MWWQRASYVAAPAGLALAIGVAAAVAGGTGVANAEPTTHTHTGVSAHQSSSHDPSGAQARKTLSANVSAHVRAPAVAKKRPVVSAPDPSPSTSTDDPPVAPMQMALGAMHLARREIESSSLHQTSPKTAAAPESSADPTVVPGGPDPADETPTAYGDIGKWMLKSDGQIANYGGQLYSGKTLLEPVNVIIVDPTSTTAAEATCRLYAAMFWSGFPAQPIHSSGFRGDIDDTTYDQQPGLLQGFSDNFFLFPNDHGRIFGPDPVQTSTGYVWSGAFSTETLGFAGWLPAHVYVSSDLARTALAMRLVASGRATLVGTVAMDNAYNTATTTTGDHDGYAVVLSLK